MDNNGKDLPKEEIKPEPQPESKEPNVVIQIIMHADGHFELKSKMIPPMVIYIFETLKFSLLHRNTEEASPIITPEKHRILNFARRFKR